MIYVGEISKIRFLKKVRSIANIQSMDNSSIRGSAKRHPLHAAVTGLNAATVKAIAGLGQKPMFIRNLSGLLDHHQFFPSLIVNNPPYYAYHLSRMTSVISDPFPYNDQGPICAAFNQPRNSKEH